MKLIVREGNKPRINVWLPNSVIKWKWLVRLIVKNTPEITVDLQQLYGFLAEIHKTLSVYVRRNGHFTLLDAYSPDGSRVIIKV